MDPSSPVRDLAVEVEQTRQRAVTPRMHAERMECLSTARSLLERAITGQARYPDPVALAAFAADWIELCPVTSAKLAGAEVSETEARALTSVWSELFAGYLALLIKHVPTAHRRILYGIRRCAVTVGPDARGVVRVRALTDADAHAGKALNPLRRRAVHALTNGRGEPVQLLKDLVPELDRRPEPIGAMKSLGYAVALEFVPDAEREAVLWDMLRMCCLLTPSGAYRDMRGWLWPTTVVLPGGNVHYEISVDGDRVVRAERLGPATDRAPGQFVTARELDVAKTELMTRFGITGIDGQAPVVWRTGELALAAGAFSRLSAHGLRFLKGTALIRNDVPPLPEAAGMLHVAAYHSGPNKVYDPPQAPLPTAPPHLHVYRPVFENYGRACCGAPGDAGPVCEFELLHEVGHALTQRLPHRAKELWTADRTAALKDASGYKETLRKAYGSKWSLRPVLTPWVEAFGAYELEEKKYVRAVELHCLALQQCGATAIAASREEFAAATERLERIMFPLVVAAKSLAESDIVPTEHQGAVPITTRLVKALRDPVPSLFKLSSLSLEFGDMARRLGFVPFTAYGATSPAEWIAESYALFCTDPHRLWEWNWGVCRWFEEGCPDPVTYTPVAFP